MFDENVIADNYERFQQAFTSCYAKPMICYSIKTNCNLVICRILRETGAFAEVGSELDLQVALKAGFSGDNIIFDGLYKSEKTLRTALKAGVLLVNVESLTERERINKISEELGMVQAVGVRLNPRALNHRRRFSSVRKIDKVPKSAV